MNIFMYLFICLTFTFKTFYLWLPLLIAYFVHRTIKLLWQYKLNFRLRIVIFINSFFYFFMCEQNLVLHNTSRKDVEWNLDIRNTGKLFKDGIFKFSTLSGTLQPNEECNVAVNFCPSRYFFPVFVVISISVYHSHILFYYVYETLYYYMYLKEF